MKSSPTIRIITVLSIGVVFASSLAWFGLGHVTGSLKRVNAFGELRSRPEKASTALNYLLVGSDTREGLTKAELKTLRVGSTASAAGKRSDTILLVHISKARDKAVIISLPRDTLVTIPQRTGTDGKIIPATPAKLNAAFNWGGAPLLVQVIEAMTQLRIDNYIEINFAGFTRMVDALGGIQVCTKTDINDPKSHLVLKAGIHTLNGIEALKYVRTRDFDGMGDLGRMQRQQQFMSSVLRKAMSTGVLLNPVKLIKFINAALATVKTDSSLNSSDLVTLAKQARNLSASKIRTLTVPLSNINYSVPGVGSTVVWDPVLAPELFQRLRNDLTVVDVVAPTPSASASPSASGSNKATNTTTAKASASATPTIIDKFKTRTANENPCGALK
ncbi:MAG: LCP family protein [Actinobacteria bacterium]|nr:LCP family protein [Actinomycetota bacterium]